MAESVFDLLERYGAKFVALNFTTTEGEEKRLVIPSGRVDENFIELGKVFDGSSIRGWRGIDKADMLLMPDPDTARIDPFVKEPTLNIRCDIVDPETGRNYEMDPRSICKAAEAYMRSTDIADTAYFGPEPEFFVFDDVRFSASMEGAFYHIDSQEAAWNSGAEFELGNFGHRPKVKGGYLSVPPMDTAQDLRAEVCLILEEMGIAVEALHQEVATANQNEITTRFDSMTRKADEVQVTKYVVRNVAHHHGKTATFMPKPLVGDNGSGMHCHQSLAKDGVNLFFGDQYAGLSTIALHYIGGILKHSRAINAFANPTTNSYKRLVPGFEAPVALAYSASNRSASIRIPHSTPKGVRIEVRYPDPTANPYLAFTAMLMAGLDGVINKIDPGPASDRNLYNLSENEANGVLSVAGSLNEAINALDQDREFLKQGSVMTDEVIDRYIAIKREDVLRLRQSTHPVEFELYYSS